MSANDARHNYVSLTAAAKYAGCSVKTLRRRISDGTLPGYRFGPRAIRVSLEELDAVIRPIPTGGGAR